MIVEGTSELPLRGRVVVVQRVGDSLHAVAPARSLGALDALMSAHEERGLVWRRQSSGREDETERATYALVEPTPVGRPRIYRAGDPRTMAAGPWTVSGLPLTRQQVLGCLAAMPDQSAMDAAVCAEGGQTWDRVQRACTILKASGLAAYDKAGRAWRATGRTP